ncbi:MAG: 6,7-dimethyl-8-ribityllumazine synthase [Dongiaceae bacterium]
MSQGKVLIVEARFYEDIADELIKGVVPVLQREGFTYDRIAVPGSFEIPAAIAMAAAALDPATKQPRYAGYVALGCIVRGQTSHYELVSGESARGLQDLAVQQKLAIGYGIICAENMEQAWERAKVDGRNNGAHAAAACVRMIALRKLFGVI